MNILQRQISPLLQRYAQEYPIVSILGPRQAGKSTLVRALFPGYTYCNLENPSLLAQVREDPLHFLNAHPEGLILDEAQNFPEVFSYLQIIVDESKKKGQFILTGSQQFQLLENITQSLAGRTALCTLMPLSLAELEGHESNQNLDELILKGFYPRIYAEHLNPQEVYRFYYQTYLERDVRRLIQLKDLHLFQRFMKLLVGRISQILNKNNLASDVGVSAPTIEHWLTLLEASFVIVRLYPYYENFGKRIIKAPKVYFTDVGLASYLLEIENTKQLARDPLRAALIENLAFTELYKTRLNQGLEPHLYYYRDSSGLEVDFILSRGRMLTPIEVKSSQTFHTDFLKGIERFQTLAKERSTEGFLILGGGHNQAKIRNIQLMTIKEIQLYHA